MLSYVKLKRSKRTKGMEKLMIYGEMSDRASAELGVLHFS